MTCLEKFLQVRGLRRNQSLKQRDLQRYEIDGLRLERWMLKVLIGVAYEQPTPRGEGWGPPRSWVEIAFGLLPFPKGCGLYVGGLAETRLELRKNQLRIERLTGDGESIHGALFDLNGWNLTLALLPLGWPELDFRPAEVVDRESSKIQQVITFDWRSQ